MKKRSLFLLLAIAALLPFLPNARDFFVGDDFCLMEQSRAFTWQTLLATGPASYFRPLPLGAYHLLGIAVGLHSLGFHLASAFLHLANTLLVFALFLRYTENKKVAALAGLAFSWHFAHAEAVIWISSLNELLVTGFGLLFLLCGLISYEKKGRGWMPYIASLVFLALALGSKENAVILPLIAWGMFFLDGARSKKGALLWIAPPFLMVLGFIGLRSSLGAAMPTWTPGRQGAVSLSPIHILSNFGHFGVGLLVPLRFFFDLAGYGAYERLTQQGSWNPLLSLGLLAAVLISALLFVLLVRLLRPGRDVWAGILWVGIALLPYVFFSGKGERFLYFPSAGACLAIGSFLSALIAKRKGLGTALTALLLGLCLGICWERGRWWTQSGQVAEGVLKELGKAAPTGPPILVADVPERIHGAYVFTSCFGSAVRLFVPGLSREVRLAGGEQGEKLRTPGQGAEVYRWKEGHLVRTEGKQ